MELWLDARRQYSSMTWPLGFEIPAPLIHYFSPLLAIWPPAGHNNQTETVEQLNKGLDFGGC